MPLPVREEKQKCEEIVYNLDTAISALMKVPDLEGADLPSLMRQRASAKAKANELYRELQKAQETCVHQWKDAGRDSHYDWQECTICGKSERC